MIYCHRKNRSDAGLMLGLIYKLSGNVFCFCDLDLDTLRVNTPSGVKGV